MKHGVSKNLKILVVGYGSSDNENLQRLLADSPLPISETSSAASFDTACRLLKEKDWDVVLLDLDLHDITGEDALVRIIHEQPNAAYVVVTGERSPDPTPKAVFKEAQEYLIKGKYDVYLLSKSIQYAIERKKAQLKQAQLLKELESTNKALKDFAYIVSHDLKAPLRGIRTLAKWIKADYADRLDENGKEQLNLLVCRVDRMRDLINGVLQYSRIGHIREEKVHVDLNKLVLQVIDMVAPPKNITFNVKSKLPVIECEEICIIQVLQNLLSNAVKYIDKAKGKVEIGCIEQENFWKFSISDNGPGIEERNYDKIFQIFQALSPRDEFESTGVGLTVVKKIIELYGGKIWVESELGQGSTFFFTLPKRATDIKDERLQASTVG